MLVSSFINSRAARSDLKIEVFYTLRHDNNYLHNERRWLRRLDRSQLFAVMTSFLWLIHKNDTFFIKQRQFFVCILITILLVCRLFIVVDTIYIHTSLIVIPKLQLTTLSLFQISTFIHRYILKLQLRTLSRLQRKF